MFVQDRFNLEAILLGQQFFYRIKSRILITEKSFERQDKERFQIYSKTLEFFFLENESRKIKFKIFLDCISSFQKKRTEVEVIHHFEKNCVFPTVVNL